MKERNTVRWKGKLLKDVQRQRQEHRPEKTDFSKLYDKPKTVEFKKYRTSNNFRAMDKDVLKSLSTTAIVIYPVLCFLSDFKKHNKVQISIENIGVYAGIKSWITVEKGLKELKAHGLINAEKIIQKRRYWIYDVVFVRKSQIKDRKPEDYITFYVCTIESGIWARLTPKEKHLYIILRTLSKFDYQHYKDNKNDTDHLPFQEAYTEREYEIYFDKWVKLAKEANMDVNTIKKALRRLENNNLIKWYRKEEHCALEVNLIHERKDWGSGNEFF